MTPPDRLDLHLAEARKDHTFQHRPVVAHAGGPLIGCPLADRRPPLSGWPQYDASRDMETLMLRDLLPAIGGVALGAVRLLRLVVRPARRTRHCPPVGLLPSRARPPASLAPPPTLRPE